METSTVLTTEAVVVGQPVLLSQDVTLPELVPLDPAITMFGGSNITFRLGFVQSVSPTSTRAKRVVVATSGSGVLAFAGATIISGQPVFLRYVSPTMFFRVYSHESTDFIDGEAAVHVGLGIAADTDLGAGYCVIDMKATVLRRLADAFLNPAFAGGGALFCRPAGSGVYTTPNSLSDTDIQVARWYGVSVTRDASNAVFVCDLLPGDLVLPPYVGSLSDYPGGTPVVAGDGAGGNYVVPTPILDSSDVVPYQLVVAPRQYYFIFGVVPVRPPA